MQIKCQFYTRKWLLLFAVIVMWLSIRQYSHFLKQVSSGFKSVVGLCSKVSIKHNFYKYMKPCGLPTA